MISALRNFTSAAIPAARHTHFIPEQPISKEPVFLGSEVFFVKMFTCFTRSRTFHLSS